VRRSGVTNTKERAEIMPQLVAGPFEDTDRVQSASEAQPAALGKQLRALAEVEILGADLYARVFDPLTKDATEKMVCCRHAAEEMAHHLAIAEALRALGIDVSGLARQPFGERRFGGSTVGLLSWTWPDRAAYSALAEAATLWQFQRLAQDDEIPLADVLSQVLREEEDHVAEGWRILRGLCGSPEGRRQAQNAVLRVWPAVLQAVGQPQPDMATGDDVDAPGRDGQIDARRLFIDEQQRQLGWLCLSLPGADPL
jgi:1,2-phenylacetyl-CoA epoxidase catalytic subunit